MGNLKLFTLIFSLMLMSIITRVSGIHCYSCESLYEPHCGENFENENYFKLNCAAIAPPRYLENDLPFVNATACVKWDYTEDGERKTVRGCYFGTVNDTADKCRMDPIKPFGADAKCFLCNNENYCNTANVHWPTIILVFTFSVTVSIFSKLMIGPSHKILK